MSAKLEAILANTTPEKISPHVSPTLHPDSILPLGAVLAADDTPLSAEAFSSARQGLRALYQTLNDVEIADIEMRKQHGSALVVDGKSIRQEISPERANELAATMGQRWESVARIFDQHLGRVRETQEALAATIEKALTNPKRNEPSVAAAASDIRKYIASLPDAKRMDFLHGAVESGDHEIASAVLATTPWVTGINREQFGVIKDLASKKFAEREYQQHAALARVVDAMTLAARNFTARFEALLPKVRVSPADAAMKALKTGA